MQYGYLKHTAQGMGFVQETVMPGIAARLARAAAGAACLIAVMLPLAAHASEVTFDWVPIVEDPSSAQTTTASGSITFDLSSWAMTNPNDPPNLGPYYTSGSAISATITAFSFTSADGQTADLADLSTTTIGSMLWATSAIDTPATGAQAPSAPTAGYYLVTPFVVTGDAAGDTPFKIANNTGVAGATYDNGVPNGDVNFNADGSIPAVENGGYWELVSASPVPLPGGLPLLLGGLALLGWATRRRATVSNLSRSVAM